VYEPENSARELACEMQKLRDAWQELLDFHSLMAWLAGFDYSKSNCDTNRSELTKNLPDVRPLTTAR